MKIDEVFSSKSKSIYKSKKNTLGAHSSSRKSASNRNKSLIKFSKIDSNISLKSLNDSSKKV